MNTNGLSTWSRREVLRRMSVAAGAGLLGLGARTAVAEPPPETRTIRLLHDPEIPILCYAPQYLAEEFLRIEGFTDVRYNEFGDAVSDSDVLVRDRAYIVQVLEETSWVIEGPHGAAKRLGLNPSTLRGRMRKLGIAKGR